MAKIYCLRVYRNTLHSGDTKEAGLRESLLADLPYEGPTSGPILFLYDVNKIEPVVKQLETINKEEQVK